MQRHGAGVRRFCQCALRDAALADDVLQQVFLQVYCDLASFAGRSSVRTWLFAIARHRVLDAARLRKRAAARFGAYGAVDAEDTDATLGERIDDARRERALWDCVAELAEPMRTAILLRYKSGFSFGEMAEICGEKAGTLQARVARALPALRTQVERRCGGTL
jgi:RNA polymerase sigma-70 factor, ECF subfamily